MKAISCAPRAQYDSRANGQIEASQHRITHAATPSHNSEHPYVKILFQTCGVSYFEQNGCQIEIKPGDCLAYDVSCPHTIISPSLLFGELTVKRADTSKDKLPDYPAPPLSKK